MGPKLLRNIRKRAKGSDDILLLLDYIDKLEDFLDDNQEDDNFGTEGWRHAVGSED